MKNSEKILIQNLFNRLSSMETIEPSKDEEAFKFIENLSDNQKNSIYYMVQTILIQETMINDLKNKINFLEKNVLNNNQSSFLSSSLQKKIVNSDYNSSISDSQNIQNDTKNCTPRRRTVFNFLGNALQTAAGVAGGILAGNLLTNLFNYSQENSSSNSPEHINQHHLEDESSKDFSENNVLHQDILCDNDINQDNFEYLDYNDDFDSDYN